MDPTLEQIADAEALTTRDFLRKHGRAALERMCPIAAYYVRYVKGERP